MKTFDLARFLALQNAGGVLTNITPEQLQHFMPLMDTNDDSMRELMQILSGYAAQRAALKEFLEKHNSEL